MSQRILTALWLPLLLIPAVCGSASTAWAQAIQDGANDAVTFSGTINNDPSTIQSDVQNHLLELCQGCNPSQDTQSYQQQFTGSGYSSSGFFNQGGTALYQQCNVPNPPPQCRCLSANPLADCSADQLTPPESNSAILQGTRLAEQQIDPNGGALPTRVCDAIVPKTTSQCSVTRTLTSAVATQDLVCKAYYTGSDYDPTSVQFYYLNMGLGSNQLSVQIDSIDWPGQTMNLDVQATTEDKFGCTGASLPGIEVVLPLELGATTTVNGYPPFCNNDCSCGGLVITLTLTQYQASFDESTKTNTMTATLHAQTNGGHDEYIAITYHEYRSDESCYWGQSSYSIVNTPCTVTGSFACSADGPPYRAIDANGGYVVTNQCSQQQAAAVCETSRDASACDSYQSCTLMSQQCLNPAGPYLGIQCLDEQRTYGCGEQCVASDPSLTNSLDLPQLPNQSAQDFLADLPRTATYAAMLEGISSDTLACDTPDQTKECVRAFPGTAQQCGSDLVCDYCACNGGMCGCQNPDLKDMLDRGLCSYVGEFCSGTDFMGNCISWKKTWCCFGGVLARIIQEQGRPQLGLTFGSPESADCSGLTIQQLQQIDWSLIDFTEFTNTLVTPTPPNQADIQNNYSQTLNP